MSLHDTNYLSTSANTHSSAQDLRLAYPPTVVKGIPGQERSYDIFSALNADRIVYLYGPVTTENCAVAIAQLLYLDSIDESKTKPIYLYIQSPGGSVYDGLGLADIMDQVKCPVYTVGVGFCMSMGAYLLACGEKGHRYATKRCRIMIHQPSGGAQGQATEIEISAKEILYLRKSLNEDLARYTGQPFDVVDAATERDNFMSAEEAKTFGIIDQVLDS